MDVSRAKTGLLAAAFVLGMWAPPPTAHAKKKMNRPNHLVKEKSPYLLQHAYNPVEWFPWGEAAFKKARAENKPILLSIGYSTCHWCHVMERESFSDPKLAALLNKHFVSIKVDREERPDIDKIYMTAEGHDKNLIARVMEDSDGVEPAPSSVAALNLLRLANLTGREGFDRDAEKTLEGFGALMRERPTSLPKMLSALGASTRWTLIRLSAPGRIDSYSRISSGNALTY